MYCPNCKQEFEGKFCPECGTKLEEKPQQTGNGISLNLGDANAISGGVHLQDSHDIHNIDNSVHNTSTVNNVTNITNVAAQKTELEILHERKTQFMAAVTAAFADGIVDENERIMLENERIRIGLDAVTAKELIESVRKNVAQTHKSALTPVQQIMLKQITQFIDTNDVENLKRQLPRLEGIAQTCIEEDVSFKYYLVAAAINPEGLIHDFEAAVNDDYWKTYWAYIAYTKKNDFRSAENILNSLSLYTSYPQENVTLLASVSTMRECGKDTAQTIIDKLEGTYSPQLNAFANAIYLLIYPELAAEMGIDEASCAFYRKNVLEFEDDEARARREAMESALAEAEANRRFNLRLNAVGNNSFKVSMVLKSGLGISLSEAKALIDACPIDVVKGATREQLATVFDSLKQAGADVELV